MSRSKPRRPEAYSHRASVFAALGDETRLRLVGKLAGGVAQSISRLADGSALSRQAITKHLRVLEDAGVVGSLRAGRETLFELRAEPLADVRSYLDDVADEWEGALARLKAFVET